MPTASVKLDASQPQKVRYAVDLWQRDEQIRLANMRPLKRIQPHPELRPERIAVVGFGPSLAETWEQVRDFDYRITCSGSHRFLLDKGLVPTKGRWWHVEVDPRPHKVRLLGDPNPDVEYLIASTCSPAVFDHLAGYDVTLWHVFDPKEEGFRVLPAAEWALTGGCDVGLRAMTIARFFGFTNLHMFGFDGCQKDIGKHAAAHPNEAKGFAELEYDGVTYHTTPSMLECARQVGHELNQMPDVQATWYGEGLTQHMMRNYVPDPVPTGKAVIGFTKPELISAEYVKLNAQLHRDNLAYGVGGAKHAPTVLKLAASLKTTCVLDYGAGKGLLGKALPWPIWEYDPAIPEKSASPRPADIVVCSDVLEHVEPDKLGPVLDDLRRCVKQVGFFTIHTGPAQKVLADGRNAHLLQKGKSWWTKQLSKYFQVGKVLQSGPELYVVVGVKQKPKRVAA